MRFLFVVFFIMFGYGGSLLLLLLLCLLGDRWFVLWECCGVNFVLVKGEIFFWIEIFGVFCGVEWLDVFWCGFKKGILIGDFILGMSIGDLCFLSVWCVIVGVEIGDFCWGVVVGVLVNDFWYGVGG